MTNKKKATTTNNNNNENEPNLKLFTYHSECPKYLRQTIPGKKSQWKVMKS